MTNYNMRKIMTIAHGYRKEYGVDMSRALKAAWVKAKKDKVSATLETLEYHPVYNRYANDWQQYEILVRDAYALNQERIYILSEHYKAA